LQVPGESIGRQIKVNLLKGGNKVQLNTTTARAWSATTAIQNQKPTPSRQVLLQSCSMNAVVAVGGRRRVHGHARPCRDRQTALTTPYRRRRPTRLGAPHTHSRGRSYLATLRYTLGWSCICCAASCACMAGRPACSIEIDRQQRTHMQYQIRLPVDSHNRDSSEPRECIDDPPTLYCPRSVPASRSFPPSTDLPIN
jgi:hypothetical protein